MVEPLKFDQLDRKYAAMKLRVIQDFHTPPGDVRDARSKSWQGGLNDGPLQLLAAESHAAGEAVVESCGISALDSGGIGFLSELEADLKLGAPDSENVLPNGLRASVWKESSGGRFVLIDATPQQKPGFMLTFETRQGDVAAHHQRLQLQP